MKLFRIWTESGHMSISSGELARDGAPYPALHGSVFNLPETSRGFGRNELHIASYESPQFVLSDELRWH